MPYIQTSMKLWPLFVTVMPSSSDESELRDYMGRVNALYRRRERFATLVDTSFVTTMPSAAERRLLADWQHETVDSIRRYNVFTATVIRSPIARGAFTALQWLFPPPNEQVSVASLGEGLAACIAKLAADGLALSPHLLAWAPRAQDATIAQLVEDGSRAEAERA